MTASLTLSRRQFVEEWQTWHDAADAARAREHGPLGYAGFHILASTPQRFTHLPGEWSTGAEGPVVQLADGEHLRVGGAEITGRHSYGPIGERTFHRVEFGDTVVEVSRRGGEDIVRPVLVDTAWRSAFQRTPAFEPDPRWVVAGEFERFDQAPDVEIEAAIPEITHVHTAAGRVHFEWDGERHSLLVLQGAGSEGSILFRDATSGVTTYGASRRLGVTLPPDGETRIELDFTRASNLQCAYTDYSPCPLAPAENVLPFAIEAGERTPLSRSSDY